MTRISYEDVHFLNELARALRADNPNRNAEPSQCLSCSFEDYPYIRESEMTYWHINRLEELVGRLHPDKPRRALIFKGLQARSVGLLSGILPDWAVFDVSDNMLGHIFDLIVLAFKPESEDDQMLVQSVLRPSLAAGGKIVW